MVMARRRIAETTLLHNTSLARAATRLGISISMERRIEKWSSATARAPALGEGGREETAAKRTGTATGNDASDLDELHVAEEEEEEEGPATSRDIFRDDSIVSPFAVDVQYRAMVTAATAAAMPETQSCSLAPYQHHPRDPSVTEINEGASTSDFGHLASTAPSAATGLAIRGKVSELKPHDGVDMNLEMNRWGQVGFRIWMLNQVGLSQTLHLLTCLVMG